MKIIPLIMIFFFFTGTGHAENMRVVFATGEWPPFTSTKLQNYGRATALVSAICKIAGIQPVYKFYPWRRAEAKVLNGDAFAAFPYAISDERKASFDFSEILFYGLNIVVYYEHNPNIPSHFNYESLADLLGYRIGGISGSFLNTTLEKAGIDYEPTTSIDQSIQKLVAGRLDFCIDDQVVLADAIQRLYPHKSDKFRISPKPFGERKPTALLVSRTYPDAKQILDKFNKALAVMKQNGEYDKIIDEFQLTK